MQWRQSKKYSVKFIFSMSELHCSYIALGFLIIYVFVVCYGLNVPSTGWGLEKHLSELNPNRKSALEPSVRAFVKKRDEAVVNPVIGTSFDSLDEAYQFYIMFSWGIGFGIRFAKSRLNVHRASACRKLRANVWVSRWGSTPSKSLLWLCGGLWSGIDHVTSCWLQDCGRVM